MKRTVFSLIALSLILSLGATGCRKKPTHTTIIPGHGNSAQTGDNTTAGTALPDSNAESRDVSGSLPVGGHRNNGPEDREALKMQRIQFDLDSATIKNSEKPKLDKVAEYAKANPSHDIMIEGHCDERGTEGYNLSLGEKRALAAREYLAGKGVDVQYVYTISYGESRPIEPLHNEAAFSKNRRCEFVVILPAK